MDLEPNPTHMNYLTSQVTNFVPLLWHLKEKLYIGNIGQSDALTLFLLICFIRVFFAACFLFFAYLFVFLCVGACAVLIS